LTPEEIILNGISKAADVAGGGRHMSNHFAKPEWHIQNVSSATGNHTLHAVGVARSIKIYNGNGVAISSKGLTLFLEPKAMYNHPSSEAVVPDDFEVPFGKARIRRHGNDLSIITYGNTVPMSLQVADQLLKDTGKSVEVIDIRSLLPLDEETILASVKKTNRALIVHEDKVFGGFGAEIAAMITEKAFEYLDAPVKRVGSAFTPVGFHRILERAILPDSEKIAAAAKILLEF